MEGAAVFFQGQEVTVGVIGLAVFPAGVIDANEFVGQGAAGLGVFAIMTFFVLVIIAPGPRLLFDGTARVFMESLPPELGTAVAHVDGFGVAALDDDGG